MAEKKSGTFAKSLFGGFLGAVLALALGVGIFVVTNNGLNKLSSAIVASSEQTDSSDAQDTETEDATETSSSTSSTSGSTIVVSGDSTTLAEAVAEKTLSSVAAIDVYTYSSSSYGYGYGYGYGASSELTKSSLGSGVVLTSDGYVLTNYHVIEDADAIRATVDGIEYEAELVGSDESSDLAVIKLNLPSGTKLTPMAIGDSDELKVGQWVMTIGSPFGYEQSVATGIVSALGRSNLLTGTDSYGRITSTQLYVNLIQTDASINPGNSGGALVNANGELIGINTLITSYSGSYSGVGFAIPVNYAIGIAEQIINGETPSHASLGVGLATLSGNTSRSSGVTSGAYVTRVYDGTGAAAAGIQEGDIIVEVEGESITSATDLMLAVRSHQIGETVTVTVYRDGETIQLQATLGSDTE